jgi:hypothetical protein
VIATTQQSGYKRCETKNQTHFGFVQATYKIIQNHSKIICDLYKGQEIYDQSNMIEHDTGNLSLLLLCRANNIAHWIGPSRHFPWHPWLTCLPHHP